MNVHKWLKLNSNWYLNTSYLTSYVLSTDNMNRWLLGLSGYRPFVYIIQCKMMKNIKPNRYSLVIASYNANRRYTYTYYQRFYRHACIYIYLIISELTICLSMDRYLPPLLYHSCSNIYPREKHSRFYFTFIVTWNRNPTFRDHGWKKNKKLGLPY